MTSAPALAGLLLAEELLLLVLHDERGHNTTQGADSGLAGAPNELRPIKGRVATRLVEHGVLSEQRRKVLGLVPVERYAQADPEPERALRERLRDELTGTHDLSPRTALLVPLLRPLNLVAKLVEKDERKAADRRAKDIAEDPGRVGGAVGSALSGAMLAIYVSVGTALAISAGSDGGGGG
jgi:hypothetical protein